MQLERLRSRLMQNRAAVLGAVLLALVVSLVVLAPLLTSHSSTEADLQRRLAEPSGIHLLGTDEMGRDLLSRLLFGGRVSLTIGFISLAISLTAGTVLGALAAYHGDLCDLLITRLIDILLAFPPLLLAIVIVSLLGPGLTKAMIAVGIVQVPVFARLVRGRILSLRETEFVVAARAAGASHSRILLLHMLPNCMSTLIVQSTFVFATALLSAAALGFLGLGAQPPTPEWGAMLSRARNYLRVAPMLSVWPGLAIMVTVLALNLLGDGLRDALDPRMVAVRRTAPAATGRAAGEMGARQRAGGGVGGVSPPGR